MKNKTTSVDKIVINHWEKNDHTDENWKNGIALTEQYADVTFDAAYEQHTEFMENVWKRFAVDIDGDDDTLQGLRFSILSSYQTYRGENPRLNPLCKGLTGEVYFGWAFWDTEIYCHRLHLFVNPQAAKNLLMYRYHTLPQALQRARDLDCRGHVIPLQPFPGTRIREPGSMWTWNIISAERLVMRSGNMTKSSKTRTFCIEKVSRCFLRFPVSMQVREITVL